MRETQDVKCGRVIYVRCSCVLRNAFRTQKTACRILHRSFTLTQVSELRFETSVGATYACSGHVFR